MIVTLAAVAMQAQNTNDKTENTERAPAKNAVKLNLFALPLKNISLQYERAVARKVTIAGTIRYMPTGSIPFQSVFNDLAADSDLDRQLSKLNVGNIAFIPELRYYLGKHGAFRGFYLGLFADIARYNADIVYEYDDAGTTKTIPMSGGLTGITGGLMIGAQFKLGKKIYLDWWILGPNYGISDGSLSGKKTMNASEQQSLRDELDAQDIPLTRFTYTVDGNGATINMKGPWAGIRSGLCIGFRF